MSFEAGWSGNAVINFLNAPGIIEMSQSDLLATTQPSGTIGITTDSDLIFLYFDGAWTQLAGGGGGAQNLQQVTDIGSTTSNAIDVTDGTSHVVIGPDATINFSGASDTSVFIQQNGYWFLQGVNHLQLFVDTLTGLNSQQFQDKSGIIALLSDVALGNLDDVLTTGNTATNKVLVMQSSTGNNITIVAAGTGLSIDFKRGSVFMNLEVPVLTGANKVISFPNASGTVALISDIPGTPTIDAVLAAGSTATGRTLTMTGTAGRSIGLNSIGTAQQLFYILSGFTLNISLPSLTAARNILWPDKSGTVAMTSDIPGTPTIDAVLAAGNTATNKSMIIKDASTATTQATISSLVIELSSGIGSGSPSKISLNPGFFFGASLVYTNNGFTIGLHPPVATNNSDISLPDKTGTVALTNDVPIMQTFITSGTGVATSFTFTIAVAATRCIAQSTNTLAIVTSSNIVSTTLTINCAAAPVVGTNNVIFTVIMF